MAPNPEHTRRLLLDAAEVLFAERGIEAVSLREITAAAHVRNSTALQYHFGDRDGLVRAVLARQLPRVERERHALLDACGPDATLRDLAGALVRPPAVLLDDAGGRCHLRITAELVNRRMAPDARPPDPSAQHSTTRWRAMVEPHLTEVAVRRLHRRFAAIRFTFVELGRRAEQPPASDDRLFTSHLVDLVAAILAAPVSDETAGLVTASDRRRRRRRFDDESAAGMLG